MVFCAKPWDSNLNEKCHFSTKPKLYIYTKKKEGGVVFTSCILEYLIFNRAPRQHLYFGLRLDQAYQTTEGVGLSRHTRQEKLKNLLEGAYAQGWRRGRTGEVHGQLVLPVSTVGDVKAQTVSNTLCQTQSFLVPACVGHSNIQASSSYGAAVEGIPSMGFHQRHQHQGRSLTKWEALGKSPLLAGTLVCEVWRKHLGGILEMWVLWISLWRIEERQRHPPWYASWATFSLVA